MLGTQHKANFKPQSGVDIDKQINYNINSDIGNLAKKGETEAEMTEEGDEAQLGSRLGLPAGVGSALTEG